MPIEIDDHAPLDETRTLMREYAATLDVSLEIPDFEVELAGLPGRYAPPRGRLLVARSGGRPAGCVALRPLGREIGEVKRLYVREEFRGRGLGRALSELVSEGWLRERDALDLVEPLMRGNARALFPIFRVPA